MVFGLVGKESDLMAAGRTDIRGGCIFLTSNWFAQRRFPERSLLDLFGLKCDRSERSGQPKRSLHDSS
jgi:hypothetical protein